MKGKLKKLKILIFVFSLLGCMGVMSSFSINADELQPGDVRVSKTAKLVDGKVNTWDIELKVETKVEETTSDTVLIFDRSQSMLGTKLVNAKEAANNFIDTVLANPNSGNRIALVVFSDEVTNPVTFTSNAATLKSEINSITASGYTFTQGAIEEADALLAASNADHKQMVLLSDGQPTRSYTLTTAAAADYNNFTQQGSNWYTNKNLESNVFNRSSKINGTTSTSQPSTTHIASDRYYNHGNIAISASKWTKAKTDPINIYTIAFDAGSVGTPILNEIASPGKDHEATEGNLDDVFAEIAGSIMSPISEASVSDPMGNINGVKLLLMSNTMEASSGTPTYNSTTSTITWNIGTLNTPAASDLKSTTLTYRIEIDPDGSKYDIDELDGIFETNGETVLSYKDSAGASKTKEFSVPKVDPVFLIIEKQLFDSSGNPIEDREFDINVKGENPIDFDETYTVEASEKVIVSALRDVGDYTVSEIDADKYDSTIKVNGVEDDEFSVLASTSLTESMDDISVLVTNKEKDDGKITISKKVNLKDVVLYPELSLPDTFSFTLTGPNGFSETFTLEGGGSKTFENLVYGEYQVTETDPSGFDIKYTPTDGKVKLNVGNKKATISVENTPLKKDISVEKVWVDEDNDYETRPDSIKVNLLYDGEKVDEATLSDDNDWKHKFSDLAILDDLYTIEEVDAPDYYNSIITSEEVAGEDGANDSTEFTITNSLILKDISVEKVWVDEDNDYETRPDSIKVNLLYDKKKVDEATLSEDNDWSHTFSNLPLLDDLYTVEEVDVPDYYKSVISFVAVEGEEGANDGTEFTITNSLILKDISVEKVWVDEDNDYKLRPESIKINLLYGDTKVDEATLSDDNDWSHTFSNLPLLDDLYTIEEVDVPDYYGSVISFVAVEGEEGANDSTEFTITNTLKTMDVNVEKLWMDQDNKYNMRPAEIDIKITGTNLGKEFNATLKGPDWTHSFIGIPEDEYILEEEAVDGYTMDIEILDNNTIKLTNTLDVMDLTFKKVWNDENNRFGNRPDKIELVVLKDQKEFTRVELSKENKWTASLNQIPVGEYVVKEVKVKGYTTVISNNGIVNPDNKELIVTNTYEVEAPVTTPDTGQNILYFAGVLIAIGGVGLGIRRYLR